MKKNNKGFTLVELIVVLVILAILAAILVPALLGWIDKAKEKQTTTNAEAAYVAAQATYTEAYGKGTGVPQKTDVVKAIKDLTDIKDNFDIEITTGGTTNSTLSTADNNGNARTHGDYIIKIFVYDDGNYKATWNQEQGGNWKVEKK